MNKQLIKRPEVENLTSLSRSAIYAKMADGTFPRARRLGPNSVGWFLGDVLAWIESLPEAVAEKGEVQ